MMNSKLGLWVIVLLVVAFGAYLALQTQSNTPDNQPTAQVPACAGGNDIVRVGDDENLGKYLTDHACRALYVFAADTEGRTACQDVCLDTWLPYDYDPGKDPQTYDDVLGRRLNVLQRPDGIVQYAYGEKALYYHSGDAKPGDTAGHGLDNGQWAVIPVTE